LVEFRRRALRAGLARAFGRRLLRLFVARPARLAAGGPLLRLFLRTPGAVGATIFAGFFLAVALRPLLPDAFWAVLLLLALFLPFAEAFLLVKMPSQPTANFFVEPTRVMLIGTSPL
jgi:hypothetical protein